MKKLGLFIKALVVLALAGIIMLVLNYCNKYPNKNAYVNNKDIVIGNVKLICVEDGNPYINQGIRLYVHEETGVMYLRVSNGYNGLTALFKSDGTPYTIDDYNKTKSTE